MKKVIILSAAIVVLLAVGTLIGVLSDHSAKPAPAEPLETSAEAVQTEPVSGEWFNDAVFVGDSITLGLSYYCDAEPGVLGSAQFFCAGSLGYASALWDIDDPEAVHPYYKGQVYLSEECAEVTNAAKVFIMLGMNDIGIYGTDGALEYAEELYKRIKARSPNAALYIQSVTPILKGFEEDDLNNSTIREFNAKLSSFCSEHGYKYFDVYSVMADENGYLRSDYCSDPESMGIHFSDPACLKWIQTLKKGLAGSE